MLVIVPSSACFFGMQLMPLVCWRTRYVFPCYNYVVSGLSTPVFMTIPIVYIWAGAFPALLTVCNISFHAFETG